MKWLSYHPNRRRQWTEHNCFPHGAIKWCNDHVDAEWSWWNYPIEALHIYEVSDDRTEIKLIPREDWPEK